MTDFLIPPAEFSMYQCHCSCTAVVNPLHLDFKRFDFKKEKRQNPRSLTRTHLPEIDEIKELLC